MNTKKPKSLKVRNMRIGSHVTLSVWLVVVLFPLYIMLINSFKDKRSIYTNTFGLPETWNLSNYTDVLSSGDFLGYFKNSFIVVLLSLFLMLLLGTLASYALAKWSGRWSNLLYFIFIAGMMMPIKIASIRLLEIVKTLNLMNTIWGLVPIYVAMGIPIAIFVLTEFIRQIPLELSEAAFMDGCGRFQTLIRIIVPMLKPALASVAIYNLVPFWNDLWFPLIFISDEKSKTLLLGVTRLFGQYQTDWSKVLAVLTLSSIPVLALYLAMSRQFIKGMTAGAVKG
ncbi:MAG: carbohydrate ABC transporter permease [Clostridiales bacterium]|jgi:raffinose/stachyose/melibiose transport system permease protein|nr:carbohydrate ABC transporter permease [Clostridiales bacterium]